MLDQSNEQWLSYTALRAHLFKVAPTYDQENRTYGSKGQHHQDKNLGVNKIIRKHHTLQTDKRGKLVFNDKKGVKKGGQCNTKYVAQQRRGHSKSKEPYKPIEGIRDPLEGKEVTEPSQLLDTSIEVLKRAKKYYWCI